MMTLSHYLTMHYPTTLESGSGNCESTSRSSLLAVNFFRRAAGVTMRRCASTGSVSVLMSSGST